MCERIPLLDDNAELQFTFLSDVVDAYAVDVVTHHTKVHGGTTQRLSCLGRAERCFTYCPTDDTKVVSMQLSRYFFSLPVKLGIASEIMSVLLPY